MNKIALKIKLDLRYIIALIACAVLLYGGYKWDMFTTQQLKGPHSHAQEVKGARRAFEHANSLYKEGKFNEAIKAYHETLALQPDHEPSHLSTALASAKLGNYDHALSHAQKALALNNTNPATQVMIGQLYEQKHDMAAAKKAYHAALQINPDLFEPHYFLSRRYTVDATSESIVAAIDHAQKAITARPQAKEGYMILGDAYLMKGQPLEARRHYQKVTEMYAQSAPALLAIGKTYERTHMISDAITYYRAAITAQPQYPQAHVSLAGAYFAQGNLLEGFKEYEWRWQLTNQSIMQTNRWDGSHPEGKRVLVLAENGLGDVIQYARFAKLLKQKGATVLMHSPKALISLFKQCDYIDEVIEAGTPNPPYDVITSIQSIPYLFEVNERNLPTAPYLFANEKLVKEWEHKLAKDTNFKIGIAWQPGDDSYLGLDQKRAISLEALAPLSKLKKVSLYALHIDQEAQTHAEKASYTIHTFDNDFDTQHRPFMDTAAVMKQMDLIISVDTAIAHLAGALGVKTWILLPYGSDMRWMIGTPDSMWYPSITLFRQETMGDWYLVINHVVHQLKEKIS